VEVVTRTRTRLDTFCPMVIGVLLAIIVGVALFSFLYPVVSEFAATLDQIGQTS
jgi:hypothetical protein